MGPSTQLNTDLSQREIPMLAEMSRPQRVQDYVLDGCESLLDAIHICVQVGKLPHYAIAQRLGIDKGHWARMMQGQAHFPTNKIEQLMQVCGNYAPLQWMARECGFQVYRDPKELRAAQLKAELASLESERPSTFINEEGRLAA